MALASRVLHIAVLLRILTASPLLPIKLFVAQASIYVASAVAVWMMIGDSMSDDA